ncbi:hypothetical protein BDV93DRAFT_525003 [Ceratobasidium sp. AG-I]|nr:hypothetical protein BDV93DRAFT_525003 [Ceratobasidium sp. AG-I]
MGLPRPSHGTAHPNRASAPGMDVGAYASMDIVPPELEMTRTQSAGWSSSAPTRRDVAWPLG